MDERPCAECRQPFIVSDTSLLALGLVLCPACIQRDHERKQEQRAFRGDPYDAAYYGPRPGIGGSWLDRIARDLMADQFALRYGVDPEVGWTDDQLSVALESYALPVLERLPDHPQGRRVQAAHILSHMIFDGGFRCDACRDWGKA